MNNLLKLTIFAFLIQGSVGLFAADVPFSITLDPPSIKTSAPAGNSISRFITVENNSTQSVSLKVYAQDWEYANDGSKVFRKLGSTKTSLNGFIQLFANQIYLKPKSSQNLYFKVTSPKDYKGGLYSVVFFEGIPLQGTKTAKSNVKVVGRIGTILYHEVEGTTTHNMSAKISGELSGAVSSQNISVELQNNGNVVESEPINLLIVSDAKIVLDRILLPPVKLMPGDKQLVTVRPNESLKSGVYSTILSFQTSSGPQYSTANLVVK